MSFKQPIIAFQKCQPPYFIGVDVGGTSIKIGCIDNAGATFAFTEIPTEEATGPKPAMARVVTACRGLLAPLGLGLAQIARVGLGTPGTMDVPKGMLIQPPNHPHWWNFPIRDCLSEAIGLPVSFANDANAAAFGEFWIGTGKKFPSMVMLTLGTGVGGGVIIDGHMVHGASSAGGECGHIIVDSGPQARNCTWGGGRGHLEAYASASAVVAIAKERLAAGSPSSLSQHRESLTAKNVYEAALAGDAFSLQIIDETAVYLGIGVTSLVHAVDPGLVVLGGAMDFGGRKSDIGKRFLEKIRQTFQQLTFDNVFAGTTIDFAELGGDAGYIGAAGIARQDYQRAIANTRGSAT